MPCVLIRVVQTVIVPVTNVDAGNTVAVVTREQIAEAGASLALTILGWLIGPIGTVVISVAIPGGRDTTVVGTSGKRCKKVRIIVLLNRQPCPLCC